MGQTVRITGTFKDPDGIIVGDPTTVTLKVEEPDGTETSYAWAGGGLERSSVGVFYKDLSLTSAGTWSYQWVGTGDPAATMDGQLFAEPSSFDTDQTGWNELREMVFALVPDSQRTFVTEDHVDLLIKRGMRDLSTRLQLVQNSSTSTTSGNSITLPMDYVDMVALEISDDDNPDAVTWVDEEVWAYWSEQDAEPNGWLGRVFNGAALIYPTPTTGTSYTMRYWASSTNLADFPAHMQERLINYASGHALIKAREISQGQYYLQLYEQGLPSKNLLGPNRQPGPFTIHVPGSYWESSLAVD